MLHLNQDSAALALCVLGSHALFQGFLESERDWVPVGTVGELFIFPLKSGKGKPVFALYCNEIGAVENENRDRMFMATDPTGHFFTGRVKPMLTQVAVDVRDGVAYFEYKDKRVQIDIDQVKRSNDVLKATLFYEKRHDGYDCGEEAAKFMSYVVEEQCCSAARVVLYADELHNGRVLTTNPKWWNHNAVPHRVTRAAFTNLTPHMVSTQGSLDALNEYSRRCHDELDEDEEKEDENEEEEEERLAPLTSLQFRANIVVRGCPAWDEDRWLAVRFGAAPTRAATELQCIKPCERCVEIDVNPSTGRKMKLAPPLAALKAFRLPVGDMLAALGRHPIFGVQCAQNTNGYVHVGQTVWAKYKKCAF